MPPLASFARTGAFAWGTSPAHLPILATGTASGALDDSFDQGGRLELWPIFPDPSLPAPPSLADLSSTTAARQSPTRSKHGRNESLPGQDFDFGADEDGDDFLSEVNRPGQGDDSKREPVRSFKVSSRCVCSRYFLGWSGGGSCEGERGEKGNRHETGKGGRGDGYRARPPPSQRNKGSGGLTGQAASRASAGLTSPVLSGDRSDSAGSPGVRPLPDDREVYSPPEWRTESWSSTILPSSSLEPGAFLLV